MSCVLEQLSFITRTQGLAKSMIFKLDTDKGSNSAVKTIGVEILKQGDGPATNRRTFLVLARDTVLYMFVAQPDGGPQVRRLECWLRGRNVTSLRSQPSPHEYHDANTSPPRILHLCCTCTARSIMSRTRPTPRVKYVHFQYIKKAPVGTVRPCGPLFARRMRLLQQQKKKHTRFSRVLLFVFPHISRLSTISVS